MYRKDNRTTEITVTDSNTPYAIGVELQASGSEPLMLRVTADCDFSYASGGPKLLLEAGLYMFELKHPFGGGFFIHRRTANTTLTFAIAAAIGERA